MLAPSDTGPSVALCMHILLCLRGPGVVWHTAAGRSIVWLMLCARVRSSVCQTSTALRSRLYTPQRAIFTGSMAKPHLDVEIVSDTVCPWCYLGKKRLERALSKYGDKLDVEVKWLPFMLNPSASKEGINKLEYYKEKFGGARVQQMVPQMTGLYKDEGLNYSLGGKTGNTLNSHRLLTRAYQQGGAKMQDALAERLMKGYFTEEKFINDTDFLVEAAESVGMQSAREFLADPAAGLPEVREEMNKYQGTVSGVPHFVINGSLHLSGAQPPETFERLFEQVLQQQQ